VKTVQDLSTDSAKEFGRFVQAWTEASTDLFVGSIEVFSDLLVNLTESATPRRAEGGEQRPRDLVRNATDMASDMARNVNNALAESAKLLQRSAEKFSQTFEPEEERRTRRSTSAESSS